MAAAYSGGSLNWLIICRSIQLFLIHKFSLRPSYARAYASGEMQLIIGDQTIKRRGNLIYEFVYMGTSYKEYMK